MLQEAVQNPPGSVGTVQSLHFAESSDDTVVPFAEWHCGGTQGQSELSKC